MSGEGGAFTTPHRGAAIFWLGLGAVICVVLSCSCCPVFLLGGIPAGIVAWVLAEQERRGMDAGTVDASGRQMVVTGEVLAIVSLGLAVLYLLICAAAFLLAVFSR